MVVVYHIGHPHKVEKTVKVNVCTVKYVDSKGKKRSKETRCNKDGVPYAKGYKEVTASSRHNARDQVKMRKKRLTDTFDEWRAQRNNENALSLNQIRRNRMRRHQAQNE